MRRVPTRALSLRAALVVAAAGSALAAGPAHAQRVADRPPVTPVTRADSTAGGVGSAVIVSSAPNSVRVVAVEIPAVVRGHKAQYALTRDNDFAVMGRMTGTLVPDSNPRPLVFSVSVPLAAPAGRTAIGSVQFTCDEGCATVTVPLYVDVLARTLLEVEPSRPLVGVHAGARAANDIIVRNMGNAPEQVSLVVANPNDWRSRVLVAMPLRLAAGTSTVIPVEVDVSDDAGMGDYGVELHVTSVAGGSALASFTARVAAGQKGAVGWRPLLEANAGVARDGTGNVATAYGADLSGEVMPGVIANGRASLIHDPDGIPALTQRSLGRLGYSTGSNSFLVLTAPKWTAGGGILGVSDAGVVGSGLWGEGVTGRITTDSWRGGVFDAAPAAGGHFAIGDAAYRLGPAWTGLMASDLRDEGAGGRYAQTVGASVDVPWRDGDMLLEAGRRSSDTTTGLAWLAHLQRHTRDWSFNALASHAPSGAAAFAQAEDQYQFDGYRKLTSLVSVGGSFWGNRDGGVSGASDFVGHGWAFTPQLTMGRWGSLALEARATNSTGKSDVGDFGNQDSEIKASWYTDFSRVQTRFGVARGTLGRTSSIADDIGVDSKASRLAAFASASMTTRAGMWQLDITDEHTGVGVGVPSRQLSVDGRVDQVPLIPGRAYLRGEVLTYYLGATNSLSVSQILGIDIHVADAYRLSIDAERNDVQLSTTGKPAWVMSAKIRRAIGLPSFRNAALHGMVFADLNGNGKRDRNEHGVSGAVVLIDGEAVTTDAQGRFAVGLSRTSQIQVDPRSLPMGWIAAPRQLSSAASGDVALAIIPTSPVDVTIKLTTTQGIDTAKVHFEKAVVVLTDSTNRKWTGAPDAHGTLRFDALPPGVYEVSADLSGVGETLVLPSPLPTVHVEGAGTPIAVTLEVSPRRIRIVPPGGGGR